ncbi:hypothetical protein BC939DRAFT_304211 [Gamsiella multidivaricata]|uniref:uncharacterized protein n=1 Tax=Gamsiella multidivaricata TaxID=101098 RepID=UPI00221E5951|nr:uncharacterized protein BC939DRAFT_304211 [Gamsiella multidivaricata]KAI7830281.1 hypothetical protein BC939DRAFT_304211 [Gamsiella multidivaricata]
MYSPNRTTPTGGDSKDDRGGQDSLLQPIDSMASMAKLDQSLAAAVAEVAPPSPPPSLGPAHSFFSEASAFTLVSISSSAVGQETGPIFQEEKKGVTAATMAMTGDKEEIMHHKSTSSSSSLPEKEKVGEGEDGPPTDEFGSETSPIPEVAAVVSNTDDPLIPCMTFRFWVMGLISIFALAFVNQVTDS